MGKMVLHTGKLDVWNWFIAESTQISHCAEALVGVMAANELLDQFKAFACSHEGNKDSSHVNFSVPNIASHLVYGHWSDALAWLITNKIPLEKSDVIKAKEMMEEELKINDTFEECHRLVCESYPM